jgi:hypothetical protein
MVIAMKSLEYAVPALPLMKDQYDTEIMWPLLQTILPRRSGINRNINRSLLYVPLSKQGLELRDP